MTHKEFFERVQKSPAVHLGALYIFDPNSTSNFTELVDDNVMLIGPHWLYQDQLTLLAIEAEFPFEQPVSTFRSFKIVYHNNEPVCHCVSILWGHENGCPFYKPL